MKAPVTLRHVADAAAVSKSTAANVFNRPERVSAELRQRVETVARELGYAGPDPKGRMLSSGKVNAIGMVPPADAGFAWVHNDEYMHDFLSGVSEVCEDNHAGLLLISARDRNGRSGIPDAVVDGMILGTAQQAELVEPGLRRRVRFVVMDADGGENMSSIRFDNREGARLLIRHLLDLGHRRFAFLTGSRTTAAPILHTPGNGPPGLGAAYEEEWESYRGVVDALSEVGLAIESMPLVEACGSDDELRDYGDPCALLLDNAPDATAVVSFNGSLGPRLLAAAQARGVKVPEAVSVASFGDALSARATTPTLTVVVRPLSTQEKGRLAASMLFETGPARHLVLPVELMIGASTGPARRRAL